MNCIVERYVAQLGTDIIYLEGRVFNISGRDYKFELSELSNDMKMRCFLGGS